MGPIPSHLLCRLDGSAADSAQVLWTNVVNGVGVNLNASNANGVPFDTSLYKSLGVYATVVGTVTGTTPTLQVVLDGVDPNGNAYFLGQLAATLTNQGNGGTYGVGSGQTAVLVVPRVCAVTWVLTGTTPVFNNVQIYVIGR
jgi:hypothetical protein